jgi:hypothetical protein
MFTKKNIYITFFIFLISLSALAQENTNPVVKQEPAVTKKAVPKTYKEVITSKAISKTGFLTVHKIDEKYFFEIPDSILGREILITNWLIKVPEGSSKYGGELASQNTFYFEKGLGNTIYVRFSATINKADSTQMISKAVRNANIDPILMALDIKAFGLNNNSSVIEITDFFQKENSLSGIGAMKRELSLSGLLADRTFIESMHAYPLNIEITSTRTYSANAQIKPGAPPPLEAAKESGTATLQVRNSLMLLPKMQMKQRIFDPRVGYFAGGYANFSDENQRIKDNLFIVRYRLEPKDEDIEKYKRGELVEPKKQIVYYTDPATPKQWRKYIIAGINDWQKAFEQAGFKNAIVGKEWPENDTTMSTEDARYAIVRYLPSETANAYGPNIHDPRTGEILQSYVGWYHNIMKLLHDWYMVQGGVVDAGARKPVFSDSLMGALIRFASSHEIGHTLGLRHNMGSSNTVPVEKLRDKKWLQINGISPSIMDYARFNYVAQPEDSITGGQEMGLYSDNKSRVGDYDKWAIQWGYKYIGEADQEKDKTIVSKWVLDSLKANPRLWFGGEGRNNDPRCQTEDLGDNSMKASAYGIKNLKRVMDHLEEWTKGENDFYKSLYDGYVAVTNQYFRYMMHVVNNVGGINETLKSVEQPGAVFAPSPKAKQQEAIAFLNKELFTTQSWIINKDLLNKISKSINGVGFQNVQKRILDKLFSEQTLGTLSFCSQRFGADTTYTLEEMLKDTKAGVWSELKTHQSIDIYRRDLQKEYTMQLLKEIRESIFSTKSLVAAFLGLEENFPNMEIMDVPAILTAHLKQLRADCLQAIPLTTDKVSKTHLQYVADIIKIGLDNKFDKDKTSLFAK